MNTPTDLAWASFLEDPGPATFAPLYESSQALVYTICRCILRNEEDARDAFQSTYHRLIDAVRQRTDESRSCSFDRLIRLFANREARRLFMRRARRLKHERAVEVMPIAMDPNPTPDQVTASRQLRVQVGTLVDTLPDKYRVPILLHFFHGMTHGEIAEALETPVGTISSRIMRALAKLRPIMRRAGLGEVSSVLGVIAVGAALINPPAVWSAEWIYAQSEPLASGFTGAAGAHCGRLSLGGAILKLKSAIPATVGALGLAVLMTFSAVQVFNHSRAQQVEMESLKTRLLPPSMDNSDASGASNHPPAEHAINPNHGIADQMIQVPATRTVTSPPTSQSSDADTTGLATVLLRVLWDTNLQPATGVGVILFVSKGPTVQSVLTDEHGIAILRTRTRAPLVQVEVSGAGAERKRVIVPVGQTKPYLILVSRGLTAFGTVYQPDGQGGWKPAAGATVLAYVGSMPSTIAGLDGAYELSGLTENPVRLAARLDTMRSDLLPGQLPTHMLKPEGRSGPIDLYLQEGLTLIGMVIDRDSDRPLVGAEVRLIFPFRETDLEANLKWFDRFATTNAQGFFRYDGVERGRVKLRATASGHGDAIIQMQMEEGKDNSVVVELGPGGAVHCQVVDQDGLPVEGSTLNLMREKKWSLYYPFTNAAGQVTIDGIRTGVDYNMWAWWGRIRSDSLPMRLEPGERERELTFTLPFRQNDKLLNVFSGMVLDAAGRPVAGARIDAQQGWAIARNSNQDRAMSAQDGRYLMLLGAPTSAGLILSVRAPGFAPTWVAEPVLPGTADSPREVNFTLKPGHTLEVLASDERGRPIDGVSVKPFPATPDIYGKYGFPGQPVYITQTDGVARIADLLAGEVRLELWKSGYARVTGFAAMTGERARVTLRRGGVIRGRVLDADTGEPLDDYSIQVTRSGQVQSPAVAEKIFSPEGVFEIRDLEPGSVYSLKIEAGGYAPAVQEHQAFADEPVDAMEITLSRTKNDAPANQLAR